MQPVNKPVPSRASFVATRCLLLQRVQVRGAALVNGAGIDSKLQVAAILGSAEAGD